MEDKYLCTCTFFLLLLFINTVDNTLILYKIKKIKKTLVF